MYNYSPETCLIQDIDGKIYNIIDLWNGIKTPVALKTLQYNYSPRNCLVRNVDGTTVNIIDAILTIANGSGAGTSCLQEVMQARNEYKTLSERLNTENMEIYETINSKDYLPFKGEHITIPHSKTGYTKGLKIQGKTYQNLFGGYENLSMLNASYNKGIAIFTPKPQTYCNLFDINNSFYKTSTTYTIIIDIIENTLTSSSSQPNLFIGNTSTSVVGSEISLNILNVTGRIVKKVITKSDFSTITKNQGICLRLNNQFDGGVLKFKIMVLEGDYTTSGEYIPPYFEGIKSVGEEENNKIDILSSNNIDNKASNYKKYKKETILPYNYGLKSLSNIVYDEIIDNKVVQRVGRVVINDNEAWSLNGTNNNTLEFATTTTYKPSSKLLCDSFINIVSGDIEGIRVSSSGKIIIHINKSKLETQDVKGFKKWLLTHPVSVYYELTKPMVHELPVDNREMKIYDGVTYISSSNIVNPYLVCQAPSNPQAVVVDLMEANENLGNELDVKTKELQAKDEYLMNENDLLTAKDLDMDFRIFELEEQLTPEVAKLSLNHNSPYLMIERCIERGLYEKEDMLYKMGRYLYGKRLTQEEYDKLKLMMG